MKKNKVLIIIIILIILFMPEVIAFEIDNNNSNEENSNNMNIESINNTSNNTNTENMNNIINRIESDNILNEEIENTLPVKDENKKIQEKNNIVNNDINTIDSKDSSVEEQNNIIMKKTIESGIYKIRNVNDTKKLLNVNTNTGNVEIWEQKNTITEQFKLEFIEDEGCYTIKSIATGKVLDVYGGYTKPGTNVQVWEENGTDGQKWYIDKNGEEYLITSKASGLSLDIYGGYTQNGTNVQIWNSTGAKWQKFIFEDVNKKHEKTIESGIYKIRNVNDITKLLNVNTNTGNVEIWEQKIINTEQFELEFIEDEGCYIIKSIATGKVLDVYGGYTKPGTNVQVWEENGTDGQKWYIDKNENEYSIISKASGLCLDIYGGYTQNGTNVQMWKSTGAKWQKFIFEDINKKHEKTIESGIYKIRNVDDLENVLNVNTNTGNVNIWKDKNINIQKFQIIYIEDEECYIIKSIATGKVLDVYGGYTKPGTNVQVWEENGTDGQKWYIDKNENEYSIISKASGLCLDIYGGYIQNGTNIQIWNSTEVKWQKFIFEETEEIKQNLENGIYRIKLKNDTNKNLEVKNSSIINEANIQVGNNENARNQMFNIKYLKNEGTYSIEVLNSGKMLDVYGGNQSAGTNVQQYSSNNSDGQKWYIAQEKDGYSIISKCNGLYVDVYGGFTNEGTNIQMWTNNGNINQRFEFEKVEDVPVISEGTYRIRTAVSRNMALDVEKNSKENGANVEIWNSSNVLNQKFSLKYEGNGYYYIICENSGKLLTISNENEDPETNVVMWELNGTDRQKWKIEKAKDGYYYVISKSSGLYLDVYGGYTREGTNVQIYTGNEGNSQKFAFDDVRFGIDVSTFQHTIDFDLLKSTRKVDFVIARVGYGRNDYQKDDQFERNYSECKRLNIPIGTYVYSYASDIEGAYAEAYNVLNWLSGKEFELPVFYDLEDHKSQGDLSVDVLTQMANVFCGVLKSHGYKTGIYANKYWLENKIDVNELPEDYSIWFAAYGINDGYIPEEKFEYFGKHEIWQYSSTGVLEGIDSLVDFNIEYIERTK